MHNRQIGGSVFAAISAKLNGTDPELYLRQVMERIADHPIQHISELLPWNIAADYKDPLVNTWTPNPPLIDGDSSGHRTLANEQIGEQQQAAHVIETHKPSLAEDSWTLGLRTVAKYPGANPASTGIDQFQKLSSYR